MSGAVSWLAHRLRTTPRAPALRAFPAGETLTYDALAEAARRAAGRLAGAGVRPGDRVAVVRGEATGALGQAVAFHAITWAGAVLVPIHAALGAEERGAQLEAVGARLLVAEPASVEAAPGPVPCPVLDPAELLAAPAGGVPPAPQEPAALHSILFTSGTTGRPAPVELTHGNHLASATASAFNLGVAAGDDWHCPLPLAHAGGLAVLLRSILYGTAATVPAAAAGGFDPERLADRLVAGGPSHLSLVPTMLRRLVEVLEARRQGAPPGLRAVLVGGGPAAPADLERARARGLPVVYSYGMTETASQIAAEPLARRGERTGSAGTALFGARLEVRGEDGAPAAPGASGEIHVRGPMVSARAAGADGWLATGDFGRLDGDGWLWVEARRGDRIVTGGENVDPAEVEAVLVRHPGVAAAAVVGLDDPEWGQRVAAVVVPTAPADPTAAGAGASEGPPAPAELDAFCRRSLAPFKVPRTWRVVAELPATASGKVARRRLRDLFTGE